MLAIHGMLIAEHGGGGGVRDAGLLASTLARPQNALAYSDPRPSLFELAASYAYGLARNHPFVDANKRIALTAALTFLEINGYRLTAPKTEVYETMLALAEGRLTEAQIAAWLAERCSPVERP